MTKRVRRLKTWPIVTLFCVVIFGILIYCLFDIYKSLKNSNAKEVKIVSEIKEYGYTLDETDSKLVSSNFSKLKDVLSSDIVDYEKYATYLSIIFLADFYSLDTAISKNDIGGIQFVYSKKQESFKIQAKNSIYRYVESNIYDDRKQKLPLVSDVKINNITSKLYNSDEVTDSKAFYIDASLSYFEDLDYPKDVSLVVVHEDNKLSVAVVK